MEINKITTPNLYSVFFETQEEGEIKRLGAELKEAKEKVALPERYIINENATILFWKNGEKTVVKRCEEDEFNPRLAFLTAFFQRYCGMSKNKANKYLANLEVEENKDKEQDINKSRYKFKIGDRVKALSTNRYVERGWIGTVRELSVCPFVDWDNGEYWAQDQDDLSLIKEEG